MRYTYYKEIEMTNCEKADFTIGKSYIYNGGGFTSDSGSTHYMPHPDKGRDDYDGWDISEYFLPENERPPIITSRQVQAIKELQETIYQGNVKAKWWTCLTTGLPKPKGDVTEIQTLRYVHSEVSEACEGVRKGIQDDKLPDRPMIEVELADAVIRILDLCGHENLDLAGAIQDKLEYNASRADHKLENRLADGGKKA